MVIDVISLVCIVSGVIGCIISCGVKFKGEDRNKLIYGWLMEAILRILLVMAVLICFGNDSSDCFAYGIGKIIPVWVTAIALVTDFALLYGFTYKMSGMAEKYLLYVLPVMQMNIDKEINSGQISEIEANQQRNNLVEERVIDDIPAISLCCLCGDCTMPYKYGTVRTHSRFIKKRTSMIPKILCEEGHETDDIDFNKFTLGQYLTIKSLMMQRRLMRIM